MTIIRNSLIRLFKRKGLIFIILFPIIFTAVYLIGAGEQSYDIGFIDKDQSELSEWVLSDLLRDKNARKIETTDSELIENMILKKDYNLICVIPENYETKLLSKNNEPIEVYYLNGSSMATIPRQKLIARIEYSRSLVEIASGKEDLMNLLKTFDEGTIEVTTQLLGNENNKAKQVTSSGIGILVMSMMIFSHSIGTKMNDDKENGIFQRIMASPLSRKRYSLEVMSSLFIMVSVFVMTVMSVFLFVLGGDVGPNVLNVLAVLLVFGIVAVAITNLINSLSKDRKQANTLNVMITTPLCMLGGCFWPVSITPKTMQYVSDFVPTKWVMDAVSKTMAGASLSSVTNELLILLLFAVAMFVVSSSKRLKV